MYEQSEKGAELVSRFMFLHLPGTSFEEENRYWKRICS
jgi:hypothetical protein